MEFTEETRARARGLKLMIFDVDGVLTDCSLFYTDEGGEIKAFNGRDGLGIRLLQRSDVAVAIISGRSARCVDLRARDLGIEYVFQGSGDKLATLQGLLEKLGLTADQAGFMGDDLIDLRVMAACGFAAAPADAHRLAIAQAHLVSSHAGGRGAVREVCEFILDAQGKLDTAFAPYLPASAR
jgi:3-deoxy-D-manno-octulosonate 8-phosphate phosphatase (KDO 8-P phosphatase)